MLKFQIVGAIRNAEHIIKKEFTHVENIFKIFGEVKSFIVESDSTDRTVNILAEISKNNSNFTFKSLGNLESSIPDRYARIAYCRETYLEYVKNLKNKIDYVVVVDLDGMNHNLTASAVKSTLENNTNWDAVFANQEGRYYDIGALRHPVWSPNDCFTAYKWALNITDEESAKLFGIRSKMLTIRKDAGMIPVSSAYGGLGIYKAEVFKLSSYIGFDSDGNPLLDFVCFNLFLSNNNYKLMIDSQLINCKYNSHNAGSKIIFRFFRNISKKIPSNRHKSLIKRMVIGYLSK